MKLPNAEMAVVDPRKILEYTLNPEHISGKHKALVFLNRLGIGKEQAELLRTACLGAVLREDAIEKARDSHGKRFQVDFLMIHQSQSAIVRTGWIIRTGEDFPRLTSCYVR